MIQTLRRAYEAAGNLVLRDRSQWIEYVIQEGLLFKGNQLCIPNCSMRENLLKEKHSGGLAGHFGHDKTFMKLSESYFWPGMQVRGQEVCRPMQDLPAFKRKEAECRILSAIAHTRQAMG
jgi:hypothetical protein